MLSVGSNLALSIGRGIWAFSCCRELSGGVRAEFGWAPDALSRPLPGFSDIFVTEPICLTTRGGCGDAR
jgi:hypothetical protein